MKWLFNYSAVGSCRGIEGNKMVIQINSPSYSLDLCRLQFPYARAIKAVTASGSNRPYGAPIQGKEEVLKFGELSQGAQNDRLLDEGVVERPCILPCFLMGCFQPEGSFISQRLLVQEKTGRCPVGTWDFGRERASGVQGASEPGMIKRIIPGEE